MNAGKLRKRGKRGGKGGWREGRGRKELTVSWKKISRAGAIGSTKAMRKLGSEGSEEAPVRHMPVAFAKQQIFA